MALDALIKEFEKAQRRQGIAYVEGAKGVAAPAWKAFLRSHATFIMRCLRCISDAATAARMVGQREKYGSAARDVRASIKSMELAAAGLDERDDEAFEPLAAVNARSPAGRALAKWLRAARLRIGGQFPKPAAVKDTAAYLKENARLRAEREKKLSKEKARTVVAEKRVEKKQTFDVNVALTARSTDILRLWVYKMRAKRWTNIKNAVEGSVRQIEQQHQEIRMTRGVAGADEALARGAMLVGSGRTVLDRLRQINENLVLSKATLARASINSTNAMEITLEKFAADAAAQIRGSDIIFLTAESVEMSRQAKRADDLNKQLAELPDLSALASSVRAQIDEALAKQRAISLSAAVLRSERVKSYKVNTEIAINEKREEIKRLQLDTERRIAELYTAAVGEGRTVVDGFLNEAAPWIQQAKDKLTLARTSGGAAGSVLGQLFGAKK
jgi:hypothetical protein